MTLPREDDPRPPYVQAAAVLRGEIAAGRLKEGDKLPSARTLQDQYGIASSTVQNALRTLKIEELIYTVQGRGSYVRQGAQRIANERTAGSFTIDYTPPAWWTTPDPTASAADDQASAPSLETALGEALDGMHAVKQIVSDLQAKVEEMDSRLSQLERRFGG